MLKAYLASQYRDPQLLIRYAEQLGNKAVFKRLGYLLSTFFHSETELADACRARLSAGNARLDQKLPADKLVTAWRVWIPSGFGDGASA
jgi:predicted transcriptional regulator of viral defense system